MQEGIRFPVKIAQKVLRPLREVENRLQIDDFGHGALGRAVRARLQLQALIIHDKIPLSAFIIL